MYKDRYFVIDKEKNKYKKLIRIFGIPFSDDGWQDLFEIKYVALTKVKMVKINRSVRTIGNETSSKMEMYAIFIYGEKKNIRIEVCKVKSYSEARTTSQNISKYLGVELIDFTEEQTGLTS